MQQYLTAVLMTFFCVWCQQLCSLGGWGWGHLTMACPVHRCAAPVRLRSQCLSPSQTLPADQAETTNSHSRRPSQHKIELASFCNRL